jgi:predicted small integral membrane protein
MGPDEIFVAVVCVVLIGAGLQVNSTARMPALYFRSARGIALTRFATVAAMIWILVVLLNFAEECLCQTRYRYSSTTHAF